MPVTDSTLLHKTHDAGAVTVRKVRDPTTFASHAGELLTIYMNTPTNSLVDWKELGHSEILDGYSPMFVSNAFGTNQIIPSSLAHETWDLGYVGLNEGSSTTGVARTLNEEIDRYLAQVTLYYNDGSDQEVVFYVPNSALALLRGWPEPSPDDVIPFDERYTTQPGQSDWRSFFDNMQALIHDESYARSLSRLKNRNTPSPPPDPNPAETLVSLLDAISSPDVDDHDDLPYPTGVEITMHDYVSGNDSVAAALQKRYDDHMQRRFGFRPVRPSPRLLSMLKGGQVTPEQYQQVQRSLVDKAIASWYEDFSSRLYHAPADAGMDEMRRLFFDHRLHSQFERR